MRNNKGYEIEDRMRRFFKGEKSSYDEVDFETSKCLYEVKSSQLFNKTWNGNHKRDYKTKKHKKICSLQLGRFLIKTDNHILLYLRAIQLNKAPKYIFVIKIGKQSVFRIVPWEEISLNNDKDNHHISIKEIFGQIETNAKSKHN